MLREAVGLDHGLDGRSQVFPLRRTLFFQTAERERHHLPIVIDVHDGEGNVGLVGARRPSVRGHGDVLAPQHGGDRPLQVH